MLSTLQKLHISIQLNICNISKNISQETYVSWLLKEPCIFACCLIYSWEQLFDEGIISSRVVKSPAQYLKERKWDIAGIHTKSA